MNEMLDYVKAMSDPNRLRIIGLLTQESATRKEIAERLNLSVKDSLTHLGFLEFVGAITQTDGVYALNKDKLATLAKEKLADLQPSYTPPAGLDEKSKKVLKSVLDAQGRVKQIPLQPVKLRPLLEYLIPFFEFDRDYTEREVNDVLRRFNEDTASLRRHLVDAGLLAREGNGSRYWRVREGDK